MKKFWRIGRIIGGFALLIVGFIGLFLPVLQGVVMIVAGLLLLSPEFSWARRLLDWLKARYKSFRAAAASAVRKPNP